jgi:outer membrane protein TolC
MATTRMVRRILLAGLLTVTGCCATELFEDSDAVPPSPQTTASGRPVAPCCDKPSAAAVAPVLPTAPGSDKPASAATALPDAPAAPPLQPDDRPLPINLPTALQLAQVQAVDVAAAAERISVAAAVLEQAQVLWLPTITVGGDYNRHDGRNQDTMGNVFDNSRSSTMFGVGTGIGQAAVLNVTDAVFAPLVARQQLRAREADRQAASNDTLVSVSDAYFNVQQARGELAGAIEATRRTEDLVARTRELAKVLVPQLEVDRAEAELARRQQAELAARERWQVASAELLRVLRLDPAAQVEPAEPPQLRVELIDLNRPADDLIALGLTNRPELAAQQAQVQATLQLLRQEKLRPLIPNVLLRGFSTPVTGTLAAGVFAGGPNSTIANPGARLDLDLQLLWQLDNLGFGNHGRVHQRAAENRLAAVELLRRMDLVRAEVAQAYAQARQAARRVELAEKEVRAARDSAEKNLLALRATRGPDEKVTLVVRPLEAVAAVQALAQAYADYYGAVADANRAQFRLYRAMGQTAHGLTPDELVPALACPAPPAPSPLPLSPEGRGETNNPLSTGGRGVGVRGPRRTDDAPPPNLQPN